MPTVPDLYPAIVKECALDWVTIEDIHQLVLRMGAEPIISTGNGEVSRQSVAQQLRKWVSAGLFRQRQGKVRPVGADGAPTGRPFTEYRTTVRCWDPMYMAKGLGDAKAREILRRINGTDSASMAAKLEQEDEQLRLIEDTISEDEIEVHDEDDGPDYAEELSWTADYYRRQKAAQMSGAVPVPSNGAAPDYPHPRLPLRPDRFFDARFTGDGVLISFEEFNRIMQLLSYVTTDMEEAG